MRGVVNKHQGRRVGRCCDTVKLKPSGVLYKGSLQCIDASLRTAQYFTGRFTIRWLIIQWEYNTSDVDFKFTSLYKRSRFLSRNMQEPGGAGSEVWNRVYMIAPVKKFGRVRLSTNFPWKQIWRRMQTWKDDEFLLSFKFSRVQISRKGFYGLF